jgi:hypothetical protein
MERIPDRASIHHKFIRIFPQYKNSKIYTCAILVV